MDNLALHIHLIFRFVANKTIYPNYDLKIILLSTLRYYIATRFYKLFKLLKIILK